MKLNSKVVRWVVLGLALLLAGAAGFYLFWKSRYGSRVDLSSNLIGRWAAERASDTVVHGPPAAITGAVMRVWGRAGTALSFAGTSASVTVSDSPELAFRASDDFSVMAWIQPMQADTSFGVMSIVEKRKVGGILTARGYSLHLEYGHLACQISPAPRFRLTVSDLISPRRWGALWKSRNALAPANRFISAGPDLRDGQFHHVALTFDRDSATGGKLYVDGKVVLAFDPTKLRGSLVNQEPLLIGTHPDSTLQCGFKGLIEDVRLYSRGLSPAEVEAAAHEPANVAGPRPH